LQEYEKKKILQDMNLQINSILGQTFDKKSSEKLLTQGISLDNHVQTFLIPKFLQFLTTKQFLNVWSPLVVRLFLFLLMLCFFFLLSDAHLCFKFLTG